MSKINKAHFPDSKSQCSSWVLRFKVFFLRDWMLAFH